MTRIHAEAVAAAMPPPARFSPELRRVIAALVLGGVLVMLDSTIVNIALHTLSAELDTTLAGVQWVVTAYTLAMGLVIPVSGWLARRAGARRLVVAATATFTVASLLCGLAQDPAQLIAFRVLQGLAGGLMMPVGQIILVRAAGPDRLPRVMAVLGLPMIMAPVVGPTLGGLLLEHASWEWIFLVNVPVGIVATWLAWRMLPSDGAGEKAGPLDVPGLALAAAGTVGLTYGLAEAGEPGGALAGAVWAGGGAVLLALFVLRSLRVRRPLLDVRLFRNAGFAAASLASFTLSAAMFGGMILLPLYFQTVRHEDAVATGLLVAPQGLGAAAAMWASGRITERLGAGLTSLLGGLVAVVTTVPYVLVTEDVSYPLLALAMVGRGIGIGLSAMPPMTAAFQALSPAQIADASPQLTVLQRVGASVGTAIFAVALQQGLDGAGTAPARQADAFGGAFGWVLAVTAVAVLPAVVLMVTERRRRAAQPEPEPLALSPDQSDRADQPGQGVPRGSS
ncbi:DHA2 family efflux MFS transporter permease subunit [Spirillospora sp. NPDC048911]|uniref:DHA2 family efflux MFS transporter permease subunit n=1 Tax=Spirillospora sp. NPDC048911 TaxID=3364527 RepID=UPI003715D302